VSGRILHEVTLIESIRYANGDAVEAWLNNLLCLDASCVQPLSSGCPVPSSCDLYYVNRDTLFSYHKASEMFLQRLMSLYVSSHYKVRTLMSESSVTFLVATTVINIVCISCTVMV